MRLPGEGKTRAQVAELFLAAHKAGKLQLPSAALDFYGRGPVDSAVFGERFFEADLGGKGSRSLR